MPWSNPPVIMKSKTQALGPIPFDYVGKHKAMSSKRIVVDLFWNQTNQFAFQANEHVFNPIESLACHKLIDLVISEKITVADKRVIDLGCGSGVVGLCAITKKAQKVLFTDINPHIDGIQKHPLFRKVDAWRVQNVLADVPDLSYDLVLVIPSAVVVQKGQRIALDTFETGIFRPSSLYAQILADSGRVLKPGGELVIWLRIPLVSFQSFTEFIALAAQWFDIQSLSMLAHGMESLICCDHEQSILGRWMYKRQKGGVSDDAIWMMLSLRKLGKLN